jgi:hypothetical protein
MYYYHPVEYDEQTGRRSQPVYNDHTSPFHAGLPSQLPPGSPYAMFRINPSTGVPSPSNADPAFARLHPSQAFPCHAPRPSSRHSCTAPCCVPSQRLVGGMATRIPSSSDMEVMDTESLTTSPDSLNGFSELATPPIPTAAVPPQAPGGRFSAAPGRHFDDCDMSRLASDPGSSYTRLRSSSTSAMVRSHTSPVDTPWLPTIGDLVRDHHKSKEPYVERTEETSPFVRPSRRATVTGTSARRYCPPFLRAGTPSSVTTPEVVDELSLSMLSESVRSRMDQVLFGFFEKLCSDMDATDAGGERIHQTLMAKKMQRLEESLDYKPFKFRIQAFTNRFIEELAEQGLREPDLPQKLVRPKRGRY